VAGHPSGQSSGQRLDEKRSGKPAVRGLPRRLSRGRIGYVLFYNLPVFPADPLYLFRVWDGGMSFHGGLIGVILVMIIFARRTKRTFFQVSDFIAADPVWPGAGRLGNFINGELWGRVDPSFHYTMIFPAPVPKTWRCCRASGMAIAVRYLRRAAASRVAAVRAGAGRRGAVPDPEPVYP
jgi:prolipoprotein diacylglyceryltransferase